MLVTDCCGCPAQTAPDGSSLYDSDTLICARCKTRCAYEEDDDEG